MGGDLLAAYVERDLGRFVHHHPPGTVLTPWTPMPAGGQAVLRQHLADTYGVAVTGLEIMDGWVCKVTRADGSTWVARAFPPARSRSATEDDAAVLDLLASVGFPSERLAHDEPVSEVEGHTVIVTEHVEGSSPKHDADVCAWLGDAMGRLHALALDGVPQRAGGGWHHLSPDAGGRAADVAALDALLADAPGEAFDALRVALADLDLCEGLPQALVHVDFGGPNLLRSRDGTRTVIDWAGAGRGSRVEALAAAVGPHGSTETEALVHAYRTHVSLTDEELDRLDGTMATHDLVLQCWVALFRPAAAAQIVAGLDGMRSAGAKKADEVRRLLRT